MKTIFATSPGTEVRKLQEEFLRLNRLNFLDLLTWNSNWISFMSFDEAESGDDDTDDDSDCDEDDSINDYDDYYLLLRLSFLKFYIIGTAERHLFGIARVKILEIYKVCFYFRNQTFLS